MLTLAASVAAAGPRTEDDPNALARTGTAAIEKQRFGDALEAFTRASAIQPGDASLRFGAGVAAFMLGQNDVAQARFECALALNPNEIPASGSLAGRPALSGRPSPRGDSRDLRKPRSSTHQMHASFRSHSLLGERSWSCTAASTNYAPSTSRRSSRPPRTNRARVRSSSGSRPRTGESARPSASIRHSRLSSCSTPASNSATSRGWPHGQWRCTTDAFACRFAPRSTSRMNSIACCHTNSCMPSSPCSAAAPGAAWVNEGLATVLEPAGVADAEATLAGTDARPALSSLHQNFSGLSRRDAEMAYASAALAVRRLIEQRGAAVVVALLKDLARGAPFASAFEQRIAMRYADFETLVARH